MKKNIFTAAAALGAGVCIFATTALANYITPSGYDALKDSLKNFTKGGYDNYTLKADLKLKIDEQDIAVTALTEKYDKGSNASLQRDYSSNTLDEEYTEKCYVQDGKVYSVYDGKTYEGSVKESYYCGMLADLKIPDDNDRANKIIRFTELLTDTVVGDMKNNFVYLGEENGQRTYEIALDKVQIPEVINAGLSALTSIEGSDDYTDNDDDPIAKLQKEAYIDSAHLKFSVDENNALTSANGSVTLAGADKGANAHNIGLEFNMSISDRNSTKLEKVDLNSLPPIMRYEETAAVSDAE